MAGSSETGPGGGGRATEAEGEARWSSLRSSGPGGGGSATEARGLGTGGGGATETRTWARFCCWASGVEGVGANVGCGAGGGGGGAEIRAVDFECGSGGGLRAAAEGMDLECSREGTAGAGSTSVHRSQIS